jgi:hypothetical protein
MAGSMRRSKAAHLMEDRKQRDKQEVARAKIHQSKAFSRDLLPPTRFHLLTFLLLPSNPIKLQNHQKINPLIRSEPL